jgi:hypothetical protein
MLSDIMLSVIMLSVIMLSVVAPSWRRDEIINLKAFLHSSSFATGNNNKEVIDDKTSSANWTIKMLQTSKRSSLFCSSNKCVERGLASGGSTVVERSPHHPKGEGSCPPAMGTGIEKMAEIREY